MKTNQKVLGAFIGLPLFYLMALKMYITVPNNINGVANIDIFRISFTPIILTATVILSVIILKQFLKNKKEEV